MAGWVTSMSFEASKRVGDFGTLYATDAAAAIVKINPCIVDGPNVWKENSHVQWRLTGAVKDAKLNFLLAFRCVSMVISMIQPLTLLKQLVVRLSLRCTDTCD